MPIQDQSEQTTPTKIAPGTGGSISGSSWLCRKNSDAKKRKPVPEKHAGFDDGNKCLQSPNAKTFQAGNMLRQFVREIDADAEVAGTLSLQNSRYEQLYLKLYDDRSIQTTLKNLPRNEVRLLPHILFFPSGNPSKSLSLNNRFLDAFISLSQKQHRRAFVISLIKRLLHHYPIEHRCFRPLTDLAWRLVSSDRFTGIIAALAPVLFRLQFSLRPGRGPVRRPPSDCPARSLHVAATGMETRRRPSRFTICDRILAKHFKTVRNVAVILNLDWYDLDQLLNFLELDPGRHRFPQLRIHIAHRLLKPFEHDHGLPMSRSGKSCRRSLSEYTVTRD